MSSDSGAYYAIRVEGALADDWQEWFAGMALVQLPGEPATTEISGYIVDQAALHGLLNRIRDLSVRLIAVERAT